MPLTRDNFRAGARAMAARHGGFRSSSAGDWTDTPATRKARVREVDDKIARFAQDLQLTDGVPPELWVQFNDFRARWEQWVSELSMLGIWNPSVDEWIARAEEQLAIFEKAVRDSGATQKLKGGAVPFSASNVLPPPKPPDNAWRTAALLLLGAGAVAVVAVALTKPSITIAAPAMPPMPDLD